MKLAMTFLAILLLAACTSAAPRADLPKSITLEFKGKPGETTETRYFSNARILSYEDHQLRRDREESVDFLVANHVTRAENKLILFDAKTIHKDGTVDLHELAFPEMNEEIDYVVRSTGEVLKAGRYAPQSLFFVPSLPIPDRPVRVGDTWTMDHAWLSAKDGIPLKLQVVAILKDIVSCEQNQICADIEISGNVGLVAVPSNKSARFDSRVWGRLLFSLERGDVLWSEMRSREEMGLSTDRMAVSSCMVSEIKGKGDYHIPFACDPGEQPVGKVPHI